MKFHFLGLATKPSMRPSIRLLHEIVIPRIADTVNWDVVADCLEYSVKEKQDIAEKCRFNNSQCCVELLEDWACSTCDRGISPKSWSRLIEALKQIKNFTIVLESITKDLLEAGVII